MLTFFAITTLLLGVVVAEDTCDYGGVIQDDCPIDNCCNLGYGRSPFVNPSSKPRVHKIKNFCGNPNTILQGYCDTITDGGGWLVIQRRMDGSVDFDRDWIDYEDGFGSLTGEFWYGLRNIHCLTSQGQWELRDYTFTNGTNGYISYSNFRVGPGSDQYPLTISGFDGVTYDVFYTTTSDATRSLNGWRFSTRDRDNDRWSRNCAVGNGGWWYNHCSEMYPNNQYRSWKVVLNRQTFFMPLFEIKIRPRNCIIQ